MRTFRAHFATLTSPTCSTCSEIFPGVQLRPPSTVCVVSEITVHPNCTLLPSTWIQAHYHPTMQFTPYRPCDFYFNCLCCSNWFISSADLISVPAQSSLELRLAPQQALHDTSRNIIVVRLLKTLKSLRHASGRLSLFIIPLFYRSISCTI